MLLRNCPYNAVHGCSGCRGKGMLTDRRGIKFPLSCSGGCAELLNSVPLWLADKLDKLPPLDFLLLYFTDETRNQVENVISAYHSKGLPPKNFTRGLYKRGVD
jgi:putative protease